MDLTELKDFDLATLPSVAACRLKDLPQCCGVYIAFEGKQVFYVGRSADIRGRWLSHNHKKKVAENPAARIAWVEINDPEMIVPIEESLISSLKPAWNKTANGGASPRPFISTPNCYDWGTDLFQGLMREELRAFVKRKKTELVSKGYSFPLQREQGN